VYRYSLPTTVTTPARFPTYSTHTCPHATNIASWHTATLCPLLHCLLHHLSRSPLPHRDILPPTAMGLSIPPLPHGTFGLLCGGHLVCLFSYLVLRHDPPRLHWYCLSPAYLPQLNRAFSPYYWFPTLSLAWFPRAVYGSLCRPTVTTTGNIHAWCLTAHSLGGAWSC